MKPINTIRLFVFSDISFCHYHSHWQRRAYQRKKLVSVITSPLKSLRTPRKQLQVAFPNPFHCEAPPNEAYKYYQIIHIFQIFPLSFQFLLQQPAEAYKYYQIIHIFQIFPLSFQFLLQRRAYQRKKLVSVITSPLKSPQNSFAPTRTSETNVKTKKTSAGLVPLPYRNCYRVDVDHRVELNRFKWISTTIQTNIEYPLQVNQ